MYTLKSMIITIEDKDDQIGVKPDGTPKYRTYATFCDVTEGIQLAVEKLKAKIAAKEQTSTPASQVMRAVNAATQTATNITKEVN